MFVCNCFYKKECVYLAVTGSFSCTMKFLVKDCDPATQEPDDDGYDDEYVVCDPECLLE